MRDKIRLAAIYALAYPQRGRPRAKSSRRSRPPKASETLAFDDFRARVKFLVDECLSPGLVALARRRGYGESTHVTWLGLRSRKDWSIVRRAIDDGYVLVTNNTADFTSLLAARRRVHAGLVCLNVAPGLMSLDVQKRLFALALDRLGDNEPINELLEITLMARQIGS